MSRGRRTPPHTDEQVERVIVMTHWSTRSLARQLGMSQTLISRIWRAFGSNRT